MLYASWSRHNKNCANIDDCPLTWVHELRHLGIFVVIAPVFRCTLTLNDRFNVQLTEYSEKSAK